MNLVADENIDRQIVDRLRQDGHQVFSIAELEPSISDDAVLLRANSASAILITADKDFGELVFRQRRVSMGVILIRLAGLSPERKAEIISSSIRSHINELPQAFMVVSSAHVRIRRK